MAITINQINSGQNTTSGAETRKTEDSLEKTSAGSTESKKSEALDTLTVTPEASRLLQLEQELSGISPVDLERVDSVRHQIDAGTYSINSDSIAQKLIASEQETF
ncbi:MAG: flagellar biosynthesis anti-sigma factor FlgM [Porticoccaceae bacterium]|nr:flagellar biosynthesis anti-sigma factor FlgM [Porticoccaceae bacterium]